MEVAADYYATLGVDRRADDAAIRRAYRALMRQYHPDVNGSEEAGHKAKAINEAYACLHDPAKRADYDGTWRRGRPTRPRHYAPEAATQPLREYKPSWGTLNIDRINEEQPLLRRWKLVSLLLAALVTVATFTMTSAVDTVGAPPGADFVPASSPRG